MIKHNINSVLESFNKNGACVLKHSNGTSTQYCVYHVLC